MSVPVYVHAICDAPVAAWQEDDGRRVESIAIERFFVIGERRPTAPPVSEPELRRQHSLVVRVFEAVPAVIPARFGSLLEEPELAAVLRRRKDVITAALERVRGNVQMTLRMAGVVAAPVGTPSTSGRDYLRRRREELVPPVPPHAEATRRALGAVILDERRKAGDGNVVIYHLIRRSDVKEYRDTVTNIGAPAISVTGPFPAFAFAPDLFA